MCILSIYRKGSVLTGGVIEVELLMQFFEINLCDVYLLL